MYKKIILLALFCQVTAVAFCQKTDNGFTAFWKDFRDAVLQNDFAALGSLTLFPLTVKGTLDSDPVKKISKKSFPVIFRKCLAQPNFNYSGTQSDEVKRITGFGTADYADMKTNRMRVGGMQFKKIKGKWLLYLIYIDTE